MTDFNGNDEPEQESAPKHPAIKTVEDVMVFKLARLVALNERSGQSWSQGMFDLSLNEWRLLALTHAYGPARAGDLASLMLMDKSQLSRLIKALSEKNLLSSKPDRGDARAVVLNLTSRGQLLYSDVFSEVQRRSEHVLTPLSAQEVEVFDEMLDRLIDHNLKRHAAGEF
jgi:DNA-binding MarR family transcriptional regulator